MNNKDAYYFSHDSNARNDQKMLKCRMDLGIESYAIYFMLIEILRESKNYEIPLDYEVLSYELRTDKEKIKQVVENYDLFVVDDNVLYSKSLKVRLELFDSKRLARVEAGRKGGLSNAKANVKQYSSKKVKHSKVNNSIVKHSKKDSCSNFEKFWNAYPKKVSKGQAEKAWQQLKPDESLLTLMVEKLKVLKSTENWQKEAGQFIPHPATWLNAKGWNDESVVEIDQQNHIQSVDQATDLRDKQRIADKQHQRNLKQKASHPDHVKQLMHNAREKAKQNH